MSRHPPAAWKMPHGNRNAIFWWLHRPGHNLRLASRAHSAPLLITFKSLWLALLNAIWAGIHTGPTWAWFPESLMTVFGWIFAPVAWLDRCAPGMTQRRIGNLSERNGHQ